MSWQLVVSYFTVKPTDIFYSVDIPVKGASPYRSSAVYVDVFHSAIFSNILKLLFYLRYLYQVNFIDI